MEYYYKLGVFIIDGCPKPLRELFLQEARKDTRQAYTTLPAFLLFHQSLILKRVRFESQRDLLYPPAGGTVDPTTWDVSLLCALVQELFPSLPWKVISGTLKIQNVRNAFQHMSATDTIKSAEFTSMWADLDSAIMDITDHLTTPSYKQTMTDFIKDLKDRPLPFTGTNFNKMMVRLEEMKLLSSNVEIAAVESHKILKRTASKSIKRSGKVAKRLRVEDTRLKHMKGLMVSTMKNSLPEDFEPPNEAVDIERKLQEDHRVVICGEGSILSLQTALFIIKKMKYDIDRSVIMKKPSEWDLICHEDVDLTLYLDPFGGQSGFRKNLAEKSADVFTQMVDASKEQDEDVRIDTIIVTDVKLLQKFRKNQDHEMTADTAVALGTTLEPEELSDDEGHECDQSSCVLCSLLEQSQSYVVQWNLTYHNVAGFQKAKDLLQEERIICITGTRDHRTILAANLLSVCFRRSLVLHSAIDMHHVKTKYLSYLLIEDFGGIGKFDPTVAQGWYSQFNALFPMVQQRQIRVVLTCESSILKKCIRQLGRHDLLDEKYMVHLEQPHTKAVDMTDVRPGTSSAGSESNTVNVSTSPSVSHTVHEPAGQADAFARPVSRVDRVERHSIRMGEDEETCWARGSCSLPDGFLITDDSNKSLKRLSADFRVVAHIKLPDKPYTVCFNAARGEAAVSVPGEKVIQFVSVTDEGLTLSRKINTEYDCRGVACVQDELLWLGRDDDGWNLTGIHKQTWEDGTPRGVIHPRNKDGKVSVINPRHLATSEDGTVIYITSFTDGLFVVGRDGALLQHVNNFEYTDGVCLGDTQSLFVSGRKSTARSYTVWQCDREGRPIREIVTRKQLGGDWPSSVSYNKSTLLVTFYSRDDVAVIHLK